MHARIGSPRTGDIGRPSQIGLEGAHDLAFDAALARLCRESDKARSAIAELHDHGGSSIDSEGIACLLGLRLRLHLMHLPLRLP